MKRLCLIALVYFAAAPLVAQQTRGGLTPPKKEEKYTARTLAFVGGCLLAFVIGMVATKTGEGKQV